MQGKKAETIIIIMFFSLALNGQKLNNSSYGRFNFGVLNPQGSFKSLAMGGTGIALRDNNSITFRNPASYSSLDTNSFVFDMGLDISRVKIDDGTNKSASVDMNFRHIMLGFPLSRKVGVAAGLVPFSNGYYYMTRKVTNESPDYDPLTGKYSSYHKGTGSITTMFAGIAIDITKNFSAGINMTTMFGKLGRLNQFDLDDYQNSFSQNSNEYLTISGMNFDYGLQYGGKIKKDYFITLGSSFTGARNYKSTFSILKQRYSVYMYSPYSPDTLSYASYTATDSTRLPSTFRFGFTFGKTDKFLIGADYITSLWSDARIQGATAGMADTRTVMAGLEYIPDKYSNTNFLKRIEYRLGGHISQNYLVINNSRIKEYGLSGGVAFRMRNSLSRATFYFDYTVREGNVSKGIPGEHVFSAGASLNFYDYWFLKRKYD